MSQYQSGSCNIGGGEVKRRQIVAVFGAFFTLSSLVGFVTQDISQSARLSIFLPALVFAIGFFQSRQKFCVAYGFMGTFNFGRLGQISKVQSPEDRARDRKFALVLLSKAVLLAAAITAIALFI